MQFYIMKWVKDINDKQDIIKLLIHKYCSYLHNEDIGLTINSLFMNIDIELTDDEKKIFIANDIIDSIANVMNGKVETYDEFKKRRMEEAEYYISNEAVQLYEDGIQDIELDFSRLEEIVRWYSEEL